MDDNQGYPYFRKPPYEFVTWDDEIPNTWKIKLMFQANNQFYNLVVHASSWRSSIYESDNMVYQQSWWLMMHFFQDQHFWLYPICAHTEIEGVFSSIDKSLLPSGVIMAKFLHEWRRWENHPRMVDSSNQRGYKVVPPPVISCYIIPITIDITP